MASALELLTFAQLAAFPPPAAYTDTTTLSSGNVTAATAITVAWATPSGTPVAGTVYDLETAFSGTWGNQIMTIYADINGTATQLAQVGATFGSSGDTVVGKIRLTVRVASSTTCRLELAGAIADTSLNSGRLLDNNAIPLTCGPHTGIAFAGGNTIAIAISFAALVTGQNITTQGSTFTRSGPV